MTECISFHRSVRILVLGVDVYDKVCCRLVHSLNQSNCRWSAIVRQNSVTDHDFTSMDVFTFVARGLISPILDDPKVLQRIQIAM